MMGRMEPDEAEGSTDGMNVQIGDCGRSERWTARSSRIIVVMALWVALVPQEVSSAMRRTSSHVASLTLRPPRCSRRLAA